MIDATPPMIEPTPRKNMFFRLTKAPIKPNIPSLRIENDIVIKKNMPETINAIAEIRLANLLPLPIIPSIAKTTPTIARR